MPLWQAVVLRAVVLLALVLGFGVFFAGFRAHGAEPGSIPWFEELARKDEMGFAEEIVRCRSDVRRADGWACRNAEAAFDRRFASVVRLRLHGRLRSPLFWVENPHSARAVRNACRFPAPHTAHLRPYCPYIPDGIS